MRSDSINHYKRQILSQAKPLYYNVVGVYFLIKDEEIVYIGSSANCGKRIENHKSNIQMRFNRVYVHPVFEKSYDHYRFDLEKYFIKEFKPKFNRVHNPDYMHGTKALWFTYLSKFKNFKEVAELSDVQLFKVKSILEGDFKDLLASESVAKVILSRWDETIPISKTLKNFYDQNISNK